MALILQRLIARVALYSCLLACPGSLLAQRQYVGAKLCGGCHPDMALFIRGSVHENAALPSGPAKGQGGCEACHGPGSEHVKKPAKSNIISFEIEPPQVRFEACLACHAKTHPTLNFVRGDHAKGRVACDRCHALKGARSFHQMRAADDVMKGTQPELCYGCHGERRADFALPFHHPVENEMTRCSGCHQQHGNFNLRLIRTRGTEPMCVSCHEDKQGPFIYEHPVTRVGGCVACHQPHGSANSKMLRRPLVHLQCLECHANTPSFHNIAEPVYQNCTVCHVRIHGSHLSRLFFE